MHFVVQTKYDPEPIFLAKKVGDFLLVPREMAPIGKEDRRSRGTPIDINMVVQPRDDKQWAIINNSFDLLTNDVSHTLQALMGFGKSFCGTYLLGTVKVTTLIVVTKEDLMDQWYKNLLKYTDLKPEDIGFVQQNKCEYKGKKVVIAMVHSLASCEYPADFYDWAGLMIADECHRMSAEYFSQCMFKITAALRLGLTATPKRTDGKDFVFKAHIGEIRSKAANHLQPPKVIVVKSGWKLPKWRKRDPVTGSYTEVPMPHQAGRLAHVVKALGADDQRNHLIADLCLKSYNKGRKIVIFFEQIDGHLKKLRPILIKMGIPPKEISEYIGGLTENQRIQNAKARVILGSYAYFSEGTDIPDLDTAILASPRSNIMQAVGRILRLLEGKKEPVIFDIVDEASAVLSNMHRSRIRHYNELKANIVYIN